MKFVILMMLGALFAMVTPACDCQGTVSGDGLAAFGESCSEDQDCQDGLSCHQGRCVSCESEQECADGEVCQAGRCVDDCDDGDRCETGGDCCPGDYECINRSCLPPCAGPRCGTHGEICCAADESCEDQVCRIDCGGRERCGAALDICCDTGDICYGQVCTVQGESCSSQADCPDGQVCEVDLGFCIDESVVGNCLYHPPIGVFEPSLEWAWESSSFEAAFDQVMMAPVVANLTDDNNDGMVDHNDIPDVVFNTFRPDQGTYNARGILRVVSGDGSGEILSFQDYNVHPGSCPAVADLDLDGVPEIVTMRMADEGGGTYAFHADGTLAWLAEDTTCGNGGVAIANMNASPEPEVISCSQVLSHAGSVICSFPYGSALPAAADVDLDGTLEVVTGRGVFRAIDDGTGACQTVWDNGGAGNVAVANFDADPYPEIVFPNAGVLHLRNHDGTSIWDVAIPIDEPRILDLFGVADCSTSDNRNCNPGGGAPTVADFDGDGQAEIGLAARWYYLVYETDGTILWAHKTQDFSSAVTGSSVFDFDGDGKAEVVYNDELYLRIYRGSGGTSDADGDGFLDAEILAEIANPSGTLFEYPLIVDVDADGRSEIVVAANNYAFPGTTGLRVFGDAADNWVGTRRIWNQHSYHVTNICDGSGPGCPSGDNVHARVPASEQRNWDIPWLNNFRQNVQGEGLFWAPDLVVVNASARCLPDLSIRLDFDVMNQGSRMVGAGVAVSMYADGNLLGTLTTSRALFPGQSEHFSWSWVLPESQYNVPTDIVIVADDLGDGQGSYNECEDGGEDNNSAAVPDVICGPQG